MTTFPPIPADVPSPSAPDGSASADKVEGTGTDGSVSQAGIGILASTAYTFSVWLRVDVAQQIELSADDGFGNIAIATIKRRRSCVRIRRATLNHYRRRTFK